LAEHRDAKFGTLARLMYDWARYLVKSNDARSGSLSKPMYDWAQRLAEPKTLGLVAFPDPCIFGLNA